MNNSTLLTLQKLEVYIINSRFGLWATLHLKSLKRSFVTNSGTFCNNIGYTPSQLRET